MASFFGFGSSKQAAPQQAPAPLATPTPAPPPPARSDMEIQSDASSQRQKFYGSQSGRGDTELTGGDGTDKPATVRLLGNIGRGRK